MRTRLLLLVALALAATGQASTAVAADAGRIVVPTGADKWGTKELELVDPAGGGSPFVTHQRRLGSPSWSRDAKRVAYQESGSFSDPGPGVVAKPVDGGPEQTLVPLAQSPRSPSWSPVGGEIAYWADSFSASGRLLETLKVTTTDGATTRTLAGPFDAAYDDVFEWEQPAWSPDGKRIAFPYRGALVSVAATGGNMTWVIPAVPGQLVRAPAYSPDGKRLAYLRNSVGQPGEITGYQLVVRDLAAGTDNVIVDEPGVGGIVDDSLEHGPQSWSPDGKRIAYGAMHYSQSATSGAVMVIDAAGGGAHAILQRYEVDVPAWSRAPLPNYYIRHVEVAQAISPRLGALEPRDPLLNGYTSKWELPNAFGFPIPLIAEKSTLLRIYVGDASLEPGGTDRRQLRVRVVDPLSSITYERSDGVDVTAPDVAPEQENPWASIDVWLPPEAAKSGLTHSFDIEVNPGENEPECAGCYPNGNNETVEGIRYEEGGNVVIAPVPIDEITPESRTVLKPAKADLEAAINEAIPMLPISDDGVKVTAEPGPGILIDQKDKNFTWQGACDLLFDSLVAYRATHDVAGPVEGFGATRWVGYAPKVETPEGVKVCTGKGYGKNLVLLATGKHVQGPRGDVFAHEFGHTLGLTHVAGRNQALIPPGAVALPYPGIGGVGYREDPGILTNVFNPATTGDIMSYDNTRWTSPWSWHLMNQQILAESGAITRRRSALRAHAAATATRSATRRLVMGVLRGKKAVIFDSLVAEAVEPEASGPRAARVVAKNDRGKTVAQAAILGTPVAEEGESRPSLPFVVALPNKKNVASLEVLPTRKGNPLARTRRSKHAPTAKLLKLPKRASVTKPLTLRWVATDPDRRDTLSVLLLARRGNGKWRSITLGPDRGTVVLAPNTLGSGNKLSLRLLISDGLRTTVRNARAVKLTRR